LAAARHQLSEAIAVAEVLAAIMKRNLGWIVGDAAAGGKTCRIGMRSTEIVEPERGIVLARIVFDQRQLGPAHGTVVPGRGRRRVSELRHGGGCQRHSGLLNEISSCNHNENA